MVNPVSPRTKCSTEIDKAQLHVQLYEGPSNFVETVENRDQYIFILYLSLFSTVSTL